MSEPAADAANDRAASEQSKTTGDRRGGRLSPFEYFRALEPASVARIEALADGIFAVAMTLLVLDVKLPELAHDISAAQYAQAVAALWPKLIIYFASFISLARQWQMHRNIFHLIKHCDQQMLFWNLFVLMFVGLMPFATAIAGEHPHFSLSAAIYAGNLLILNLAFRGMWHHAAQGHRLLRSDIAPDITRGMNRMFNVFLVLVVAALALSYFNSILSIGLIVVHQFLMFFGPPIFKGRQA
jgi:TMEM175 potassium channel family protein